MSDEPPPPAAAVPPPDSARDPIPAARADPHPGTVPAPPPPRSVLGTVARVVLVFVVIAAAFAGGALVTTGYGLFKHWSDVEQTTRNKPRESVVLSIRELAQLQTVNYHMERVIDLADETSYLGGHLTLRDALLLVAAGDITAGVDLAKLAEGDVDTDPETGRLTLTLPAATVLTTTIDNSRTYVYSRDTDTFRSRQEDLESRARRHAGEQLRAAAIDAGILVQAEEGARRAVGQLLRHLGRDDVDVRFRAR